MTDLRTLSIEEQETIKALIIEVCKNKKKGHEQAHKKLTEYGLQVVRIDGTHDYEVRHPETGRRVLLEGWKYDTWYIISNHGDRIPPVKTRKEYPEYKGRFYTETSLNMKFDVVGFLCTDRREEPEPFNKYKDARLDIELSKEDLTYLEQEIANENDRFEREVKAYKERIARLNKRLAKKEIEYRADVDRIIANLKKQA